MQVELTTQRHARDLLLNKVDSLIASRERHLKNIDTFVNALLENSTGLCGIIDGATAASEESSSQLCSGVTELLTKGKVSCTSNRRH